ncbi:MAG TPA: hypothetical protein VLC09_07515 [Polyangiaceae bacterium]|nr:hypothetical protein [Polyangiaceae bacterium]
MQRPRYAPLLCALGAALSSGHAHAQANYDAVILGGRTAMMGGAATAKGSDGATVFLNPAGLIRIPGQSFAFSTVALQATSRSVQGNMDPSDLLQKQGGPTHELNFNVLPNTFCLFLDGPPKDDYSGRSRHKYGVCFANTETQAFTFADNQQGRPVVEFGPNAQLGAASQMTFQRSSLAFAWGFELFSDTYIGVNARVDSSRLYDQTNVTAYCASAGCPDSGLGSDIRAMQHARFGTSWDSAITVGITHEASDVVTFGASLATPSLHILGNYVGMDSFIPAGDGPRSFVQDKGDFRYNQPATLRLGLAFSWPTLIFEVNGNFYGAQDVLAAAQFDRTITTVDGEHVYQPNTSPGSIIERSRPVVNLAAGVEAFLEPDFSIIGGLQTDFSGLLPREEHVAAEDVLFRQRLSALHASIGAVSYGSAGSLLLGLRGFYGVGELLVPNVGGTSGTFSSAHQSQWGLSFVVSGQISFQAVRDIGARAAAPLFETEGEATP